ncbi:MAG: hypothetical protein GWP74_01570, partial [Proteobacteria bacterium]|nr:hypothetical protein [Pseudomonadota bacterium]
ASFAGLMEIARQRVAAITQALRIGRLNYTAKETAEILKRFGEQQLSLLEKTEDAAADRSASAYLADQEASLADALEDVRSELAHSIRNAAVPSEHSLVFSARIADAVQRMQKAMPLLRDNTPGKAAVHQLAAITALEDALELLAEHGSNIGAYARMVGMTGTAEAPSLYVREIEEEQRDMLAVTRKTKPDDMPALAIPQKNLVHAVDAILTALDPLAHMVESGTVMLFAKEDMDSAGIALSEKDEAEALDAQEYIVESLEALRGKVDAVVPMYQYNLEVVQALNETMQEGILVREAQRRLREQASANAAEPGLLGKEQGALNARLDAYSTLVNEITGLGVFVSAAAHMAEAEGRLKGGDSVAAAEAMAQAEEALKADTGTLLKLMKHLGLLLSDPPYPGCVPSDEIVLGREVVGMAAQQKRVYRESYAADAKMIPGYEATLREFEQACAPFIERAKTHKRPVVVVKAEPGEVAAPKPIPPPGLHLKLVAAQGHLAQAAASAKGADRTQTLANQEQADESLRHFVVEYALIFAFDPPPIPPEDIPSDNFSEQEDLMMLFMPGAVTGRKPKEAELKWDVLGKRDRAALNENFARELPLEYRAILKDYYERLAR